MVTLIDPTQLKSGGAGALVSTSYNWAQIKTGTLSPGSNTVTLTPVPTGVNGADVGHWVYLSGPTAATTINISFVTMGTPIAVATVTPHGLSTGNLIRISATGGMSKATGCWIVTVTGTTTFTLNGSAPPTTWPIQNATNTSPIVVTSYNPIGIATGDQVAIVNTGGNTATNGTWTITKLDDWNFSLNGSVGNGVYVTAGNNNMTITTSAMGGSGTVTFGPEAVLITGGSAVSGEASGTLTFTCCNPHSTGYSIASATAGIQEALIASVPGGQKWVFVPTGTNTVRATCTIPVSGMSITGVGTQSKLLLDPWYPGVSMLYASGTQPGPTTAPTGTLTWAARSVTSSSSLSVASTAGFASGDLVLVKSGQEAVTSNFCTQIAEVETVQSATGMSFQDDISIPVDSSLPLCGIVKLAPITDIEIRDLTIDANSPCMERYGDGTTMVAGVDLRNSAFCRVTNVAFKNCTIVALFTQYGYRNLYGDLLFVNSGSGGLNDFSAYYQTYPQISNYQSDRAWGFALGIYWSTFPQGNNISVNRAHGRGMKLNGCAWGIFNNVTINRSLNNGLAMAGGTYRTQLRNVQTIGNRTEGVWFSSEGNQYNIIDGLHGNDNGYPSPDYGWDLIIYQNDFNNVVRNIYGQRLVDVDGRNTIATAMQIRSKAHKAAAQSIPNAAWTALVFDTNDWDYSADPTNIPIHSTSSNTERFTIPSVFQQGTAGGSNGFGWYTVCAVVGFASNSTGERGVRLLVNGAPTGHATTIPANATAAATTQITISAFLQMYVNQYLSIEVFQSSGGALNTDSANTFGTITKFSG